MKKTQLIAVAIAALAFAVGAQAQEKQMEMSVYGDISSSKSGGSTTSLGMVQVQYGKYFTPNIVGKVSYLLAGDMDTNTFTDLGIGARYYFKPAGKAGDIVPFVGAQLDLTSQRSQSSSTSCLTVAPFTCTTTTTTATSTGSGTGFEGGVAMFVSESASFDLRGYTQSYTITGTSTTRTGFNVGLTYRF